MELNGIVLVDKKIGNSTTKEEIPLKRIFDTRKVGHLGTLDPFASGLIICGVNKGTKIFPLIEDFDKTYQATLKLGVKTDSLDLTGNIIKTQEVKSHSKQEIENVLNSFLGEIDQLPPMYSAIKKDGVPLYKLARENKEIERKLRKVTIKEITLDSFTNDTITFTSKVSKGTYIRTLGEDIASKLGELGHLTYLRRTKIGNFDVNNAKQIENITTSDIIDIEKVLDFISKFYVNSTLIHYVQNGNIIFLNNIKEDRLLMIYNNKVIAIYQRIDDTNKFKALQMF
jgi:tRNA pseudouridine55 synthase